MKRFLPLLLISLLFFSCSEEEFEIHSLSLDMERDIVLSETGKEERNRLLISASFSSSDMTYSFRLTSPDGDLVWEGGFTGDGVDKVSQECGITDGAVFPEGTYPIIIYSDSGTETETEAELKYEKTLRFFDERGVLTSSAYVTEYDGDGNELRSGELEKGSALSAEAVSALIEYSDQYGNSVSITQSFQPSDADLSPSAL